MKPWESLSLPRDLYDHLCEQYGKKTTKKIGMAFLENTKDITLHIDTSKWTKKMFCEELRKAGVAVKKAYYMDDTVIISGVEDIKKYRVTKKGCFLYRMKARCSRFCVPESGRGIKLWMCAVHPAGKQCMRFYA